MKKFLFLVACFGLYFCSMDALKDEQTKYYSPEIRQLILDMFDVGVIQFDTESMLICPAATADMQSPYYINLRHLISHPHIHRQIIKLMVQKAEELSYDAICGVPYAALALAACTAYELDVPLIMRRTARKTHHGIDKMIEGTIYSGMRILVVEDVICLGTSILDTIAALEQNNLCVSDCLVLFDRQHWNVTPYKNKNYTVHAIFTITDFMHVLSEAGKIEKEVVERVMKWTVANQIDRG